MDQAYNAYLQNSSSSNVINHVMNHGQNLQNLASNPNQKRIVSNSSSKMFGNLAAVTSMTKTQSNGSKQILQNVYRNEKQGLKKILSSKLSSNTSRLQSRTDSRGPVGTTSIERIQASTQSNMQMMNINEIPGNESTPNLRNIEPLYHNLHNSSHEIRKKSVQDIKKTNKFRNQTHLTSGEDDSHNGQINQSMNVKKDQYFQNRNGIMNRVKTQEAQPYYNEQN